MRLVGIRFVKVELSTQSDHFRASFKFVSHRPTRWGFFPLMIQQP